MIVESLLGVGGKMADGSTILFEVSVHVGTLGAVIVVYRDKIRSIIAAFSRWLARGLKVEEGEGADLIYIVWIALGSLPAAIVGIFFRDQISSLFVSPAATSLCLIATGAFLLLGRGRGGNRELAWDAVLIIGAAQALAILPGCSRSGWTITTALILGVRFDRAAEFSFLLSIPAIFFAFLLELGSAAGSITPGTFTTLILGAAISFAAGWVALKLLLGILSKGSFHRFSYYLIPLGVGALVYFYYL